MVKPLQTDSQRQLKERVVPKWRPSVDELGRSGTGRPGHSRFAACLAVSNRLSKLSQLSQNHKSQCSGHCRDESSKGIAEFCNTAMDAQTKNNESTIKAKRTAMGRDQPVPVQRGIPPKVGQGFRVDHLPFPHVFPERVPKLKKLANSMASTEKEMAQLTFSEHVMARLLANQLQSIGSNLAAAADSNTRHCMRLAALAEKHMNKPAMAGN